MIRIDRVIMRNVTMRLKAPFTASIGSFRDKELVLVEIVDNEGVSGWGECVAFPTPWYNEETIKTCEHMIKDVLIPLLAAKPILHPDEVSERFSPVRRNYMAKSAVEGAVWDLYAKKAGVPLAEALGGVKKEIDVGISIGIQHSVDELLNVIERHLIEGYKRIKIKIKPGWDVDVLREVRGCFPDIPLMADANSAYRLTDAERLKQLDAFHLMMIEQPLMHNDLIDHATLQAQIDTPVCLDESIHTLEDVRKAVELGSCQIINIKIGRVGGLTEAKKIHDYCAEHDIPVWCGGMLESGVGRAHNIALTTLPQFVLPGDTAGSDRYWQHDLIEPQVVARDGVIAVSEKPGIGYTINDRILEQFTTKKQTIKLSN